MLDVDERTVFALLRCCLQGDEEGFYAIVGDPPRVSLVVALCAWANEVGIGQYGSAEAWDRQLEVFLTHGPVDSGG